MEALLNSSDQTSWYVAVFTGGAGGTGGVGSWPEDFLQKENKHIEKRIMQAIIMLSNFLCMMQS